jgi:hypothetical protein
MKPKDEYSEELNDDNQDRDQKLKEDLNFETDINDLAYNKEADSFEFDVNVEDSDYDHPDPYKTAVKNGGDSNSTYDEANKEALDQYEDNPTSILDEYEMHVDNGSIVELDPIDDELAKTPEDDRDDLDEEGYPKKD